MNFKDITSLHTVVVVLGLVGLLVSFAAGQGGAQQGSANNGGSVIDQGVGVSTTIKTTTVKTVPPSTQPIIKTTLGPNLKTTSRATQVWAKTTGGSTINYNQVITTRPPFYVPTEERAGGYACRTSYHAGLLIASVSLFLAMFYSR